MSSFYKKILLALFFISVSSHSQAMRPKRDINEISPGPSNEETLTPKAKRARVGPKEKPYQPDLVHVPDVLETILRFLPREEVKGIARAHAYTHNDVSAPVLRAYDFFFDDRVKDVKALGCKLLVTGMHPQKYKLLVAWVSLDPHHVLYGSQYPIYAEPSLFGLSEFLTDSKIVKIVNEILLELKDDKVANVMAMAIKINPGNSPLNHIALLHSASNLSRPIQVGGRPQLLGTGSPHLVGAKHQCDVEKLTNESNRPRDLALTLGSMRAIASGYIECTFEEIYYLLGTLFPPLSDPKEIDQLNSRFPSFLSLELSMEFSDLLCRYLILREDYTDKETTRNNETPAVERNAQVQSVLRNIFKNPVLYLDALYKQIRPCLDYPDVHPSIKSEAEIMLQKLLILHRWINPRANFYHKLSCLNEMMAIEECSNLCRDRLNRVRTYIEKGLVMLSQSPWPQVRNNASLTQWRQLQRGAIKEGKVYGDENLLCNVMEDFYSLIMQRSNDPQLHIFGLNWLEYIMHQSFLGNIDLENEDFNWMPVLHSIIHNSTDRIVQRKAILVASDMIYNVDVYRNEQEHMRPYDDFTSQAWHINLNVDSDFIKARGLGEEILIRRLMCSWNQYGRYLDSPLWEEAPLEDCERVFAELHKSASLCTSNFLTAMTLFQKSPLNCIKVYAIEMLKMIETSYATYFELKKKAYLSEGDKALRESQSSHLVDALTVEKIREFFSRLDAKGRFLKHLEQPVLKVRPLD